MHDTPADVMALTSRTLSKADEVVNKDVDMHDWSWEGLQGGTVCWLQWSDWGTVISQWAEHGQWTMIIGRGWFLHESWGLVISQWAEGGQKATCIRRGWLLTEVIQLRWFPAIMERCSLPGSVVAPCA